MTDRPTADDQPIADDQRTDGSTTDDPSRSAAVDPPRSTPDDQPAGPTADDLVAHTVEPTAATYGEAVWQLKERINREEGLLAQDPRFFAIQYRRSRSHLLLDDGEVVAFAVVGTGGYLSLLGVAPAYRRRGLGSRLLERVLDDHARVHCHARVTNATALGFYAEHGFAIEDRIEGYYRDGTDAYLLVHDARRADRIDRLDALLR